MTLAEEHMMQALWSLDAPKPHHNMVPTFLKQTP